jgi:uncharacterized membrane protein YgaE (UPF0421/DUF939 family)
MQVHTGVTSPVALARAAMADHQFQVIAMLLGAIVGLISTFGVMDPTARSQLVTMLLLPVPMVPALALGIALGGQRTLELVVLTLIMAGGTYCRRFGPRGFIAGILLFIGNFFGFFLHGAIKLGDLGWLVAEIGIGLAVAIAVRFVLFYPHLDRALARTQRSYAARARKVAALALEIFDGVEHSERVARRLRHQIARLNEAALMIDAQLGDSSAVAEGSSSELLHQRLFDFELALTNVARFAEAIARLEVPSDQRSEVRLALLDIVRGDADGARAHAVKLIDLLRLAGSVASGEDKVAVLLPHRFAGSVVDLADATTEWVTLGTAEGAKGTFKPSVTLFGGWLPGSTQVSAAASLERGSGRGDRNHLAPYTRTAIQMGVAVGLSIALGSLLSERRFYWAVIAAFITFMGVNNSGEQIRKALQRVGGTVIGIAVGSLLAKAVGAHTYWSIAVILVSLFFAFYLMRINYAFMVVGITVMVSQLYMQLDEFSNSLLVLRLEETALGAAVAIAVVLLVLPLRTRRVLRIALRQHVEAIGRLVDRASRHLVGAERDDEGTLRSDTRAVDASYQVLIATARPLWRNVFGGDDEATSQAMRLASASRNYSRDLVADIDAIGPLDAETTKDVERAGATLQRSLETIAAALNGPRDGIYTRSSALFDRAERRMKGRFDSVEGSPLAIHDLKLIDGAMAKMAELIGLDVTDYDTTRVR